MTRRFQYPGIQGPLVFSAEEEITLDKWSQLDQIPTLAPKATFPLSFLGVEQEPETQYEAFTGANILIVYIRQTQYQGFSRPITFVDDEVVSLDKWIPSYPSIIFPPDDVADY